MKAGKVLFIAVIVSLFSLYKDINSISSFATALQEIKTSLALAITSNNASLYIQGLVNLANSTELSFDTAGDEARFTILKNIIMSEGTPPLILDLTLRPFTAIIPQTSTVAINVGTGDQILVTPTGTELQFRTLTAGSNIVLTQNANDINIATISFNGDITTGFSLTQPTVFITPNHVQANIGLTLLAKGTGPLTARVPDNTATGGNVRGNNAVDWQVSRVAASQAATGAQSVIGGGLNNTASGAQSTVAGGNGNAASDLDTFVGGGLTNTASAPGSVVCGGANNIASAQFATVGGGVSCTASGLESTVAGGFTNTASGDNSTISGGNTNAASGLYSIICGGFNNLATGDNSFVAGSNLQANHQGAFLLADSAATAFASSVADQMNMRFNGGYRLFSNDLGTAGVTLASGGNAWVGVSDKNLKENFEEIDTKQILEQLAALPITKWNYKSEDASIKHIGPMAQDFWPTFNLGSNPLGIETLDYDGVALASIQGLYNVCQELKANLEDRDKRIASLEAQEEQLTYLKAELEALKAFLNL